MINHERISNAIRLGFAKRRQAEHDKKEAARKRAEQRAERRAYTHQVRQLTERQPLDQVPGIALRGPDFHLDHAVSIAAAFKAGWSPEQCADVANLQVLPRAENMRKGQACYCNLMLTLNLNSRLTAN
jgi:hypothetical protein